MMHVALIANTAWFDEELSMFRYLMVGLLDEQVRVAQVVPERVSSDDISAFGDHVAWRDSSWTMARAYQLRRLSPRLDRLGVDLLHALDGRVWQGALRLARTLKLPTVLSASSSLDVPLARRLKRTAVSGRAAFAAATKPLAEAMREVLGPEALIEEVPTGVQVSTASRERLTTDSALCAVISGNGVYDSDYEVLFAALRTIVRHHPHAQFFFDGQGNEQHELWQAAARFGLLNNMSMVARRLGHRELLLGADVLIHPQPLGRGRSLTLQAMAQGMPVLARHDPWLDYLIHDTTAWVVQDRDSAAWTKLLDRLLQQPQDALALGESARQWVSQNRLTSRQIGATLELYRRLTGESIQFPTSD